MNFNSKRSVTDEQNERHKRLLASILKEEGNKSCADCKTRNPTWASVNLGVFVCLTCSGIHRSLGVHISQVRSCNLDTWLPKQVEFCRVMGNTKGNRYWESRLPKDFRRPPSGNPNPELASFIRAKYVDRAFAATDAEPPTIDNYLDHPYGASEDSGPAPPAAPAPTTAPATDQGLRTAPTKAPTAPPRPAPATPVTVDLLGSFDDFVSATPTPPAPPSPAVVQASTTNDFFSAFVSAPAPAAVPAPTTTASITHKRTSLEWTDFHAATPPSPSSTASNQRLLSPQPSGGHQRSYSASEGLTFASATSPAGGTAQPSRFGHTKTLSATQPQLESQPPPPLQQQPPYRSGHHSRTGSASGPIYVHPEFHQQLAHPHHHATHHDHQKHKQGPTASDPFGDDLLAGLTIHHVMESMSTVSAGSDAGAAGAVVSGAYPLSSSSTPGDHIQHGRGSGHKRHLSNAKSTEEVLRLFDTEPSTGTGAAGSGGGAGSAVPAAPVIGDPFGDFLSAAPLSQDAGFNKAAPQQHQHMHLFPSHVRTHGISNGVTSSSEAFNLL